MFKQMSEYFESCLSKLSVWIQERIQCPTLSIISVRKMEICYRLVQSYLSNGKQRTKINSEFSCWEEISFGVPQGSILAPLLCDNLLFTTNETDFASYTADNTPYVVGNNIEDVISKLQNASFTLFSGFMIIK